MEKITCSLVHKYHHTTNPEKGRGNYTHNKSAKIKTFENLIIKMFLQKRKILTLRSFVPIRYDDCASLVFSQHNLAQIQIVHMFIV